MIAARAPNHLGDAVMALPAIRALARLGPLTVYARPSLHPLFHGLPLRVPGRVQADVAVLFAPSFRAAWECRRVARVIGTATDARGLLLTDRVPAAEHRAATYRALVRVLGVEASGPPHFEPRGQAAPVPANHVALNPWVARENRRWRHFRALADRLREPVVFYGGPGEESAVRALAGPHPVCAGLSLPDLAATLQQARVVVSNDTGPAHFARAVGRPTLVLHTSTSAVHTGAWGALALEGPILSCRPCMRNTCRMNLECLDLRVDDVLQVLARP